MYFRITLILMAMLLPLSNQLYGQINCSTPTSGSFNAFPNRMGGDSCYMEDPGPYFIKIYPHVLQKDNGSGGLSESHMEAALQILNQDFTPHNIYFIRSCESTDFIQDTEWFEANPQSNGRVKCEIFNHNTHEDGIDIYFLRPNLSGGEAVNIPSKAFNIGGLIAQTSAISHEMGHCLGLFHTHHGIESCNYSSPDCYGNDDCDEGLYEDWEGDCLRGDYVADTGRDAEQSGTLADYVDQDNCIYTGSFNPDPINIMSYTHLSCYERLTVGQGERARYMIATDEKLQAVKNNDIIIEDDQVWLDDREINGSIFIQSGATLSVKGIVRLPSFGAVVVERGGRLLLDGGTLTRLCHTEYWQGVRVLGNPEKEQVLYFVAPSGNQGGVVSIINNGTIEWARTAISANLGKTLNGGAVYAVGGHFLNNQKGVDFGKYKNHHFRNKSFFHNCTFSSGDQGVIIAETDGIEIRGSHFSDLKTSAIFLVDAGVQIVDGNTISGSHWGIESFATYPYTYATAIWNNTFHNNTFHLSVNASSELARLTVYGNQFGEASLAGAWLSGPSQYSFQNNHFSNNNIVGIVCASTGRRYNYIDENIFDESSNGIYIMGENNRLCISCNQFSQINSDINISQLYNSQSGSILPLQAGLWGTTAGNCFTPNGTDISTFGNTLKFTYATPTENAQSCKFIPRNNLSDGGNNNYHLSYVPTNPVNACVAIKTQEECVATAPYSEGDLECTKEQLAILQNQLIETPEDKQLQQAFFRLESFKELILQDLVSTALEEVDFHKAASLLIAEQSTDAKKQLLGVQLLQNHYSEALNTLSTLPEETEDDLLFKELQSINIERLQNDSFELDSLQAARLNTIAQSHSYNQAYARSLLVLLEGIRFENELPQQSAFNTRQSRATKNQNSRKKSSITLSPNPAQKHLEVSIPFLLEGKALLVIHDIYGKQVKTVTLSPSQQNITLNIQDLLPGIFFIELVSDQATFSLSKLLVTK